MAHATPKSPVIRVERCGSSAFKCAVAETQGRRDSHEDAHSALCYEQAAAFWVLDGHRGCDAARFGAQALPQEFARNVNSAQQKDGKITYGLPEDERIERGFEAVDSRLRGLLGQQQQKSNQSYCRSAGSTVVGIIAARQADGSYSAKLANCGDSRGVVVRGPNERRASAAPVRVRLPKQLERLRKSQAQKECWAEGASWLPDWPAVVETIDHKPGHLVERSRIEAAGGTICGGRCARLDGNLAVSRGLGDFDFKGDRGRPAGEQKVSCVPDIYEVHNLQPGALLLLACDGLWDVMSSEEAACFVRGRLKREPDLDIGEIAAALVRTCLKMNSSDNVTVLLVQCTDGSTWEGKQHG